jgi:Cadherin-like
MISPRFRLRSLTNPSQRRDKAALKRPLCLETLEARVTPAATLYATSTSTGQFYSFDPVTGALRETLPNTTTGGVSLQGPAESILGPDGNIYISSQDQSGTDKDDIFKYDPVTKDLSVLIPRSVLTPIAQGLGAGAHYEPSGLAFDSSNHLYVALFGGFGATVGGVTRFTLGSGPDGFTYTDSPLSKTTFATNVASITGLTFGTAPGDTDTLYMSVTSAASVAKVPNASVALAGTPATTFVASGAGGLNFPSGLKWVGNDLWVVDLGASSFVSQIIEYKSDGTFDKVFTAPNTLDAQFSVDFTFDAQGNVLVTDLSDFSNGNIAKFDSTGALVGNLVTAAEVGGVLGASGIAFVPNQAPTLTATGSLPSYTENAVPTTLDSGFTVADPDSPNFDTGSLTVAITSGGSASDQLGIRNDGTGPGQIGVSGTDVTYEGTTIGSIEGGSGTTPLEITLNSAADTTSTQALLRALTFSNSSDNPTTDPRVIRIVLTDEDGAASNSVTKTVTVLPVNDPPSVTTNAGVTVLEGGSATISQSNLETTDPDNTPSQLTYTLIAGSGPAHGTLKKGAVTVTSFTQADINANLISYANDGHEFTSDSFEFKVSDGLLSTVSTTFDITITPVPQVTTNTGLAVIAGGTGVINQAKLETTEAAHTPDQLTYTVSAGPTHGTLQMGGVAVTSFTQADINAGSISYVNGLNAFTSDSFTFSVSDGTQSTPATGFDITVTPLDKPPVLTTNAVLDVIQSTTRALGSAYLQATDPDNTASQLTYTVTTAPTHGTLMEAGAVVSSFTQAEIDAGRVSYVNDNSLATTDSFVFSVSDGTFTLPTATFDIAVDRITTQPVSVTTFAGTSVTFTAATSDSPSPSVQWERSIDGGTTFTPIAGATSASLTLLAPALDGTQYHAVFTNSAGSLTTDAGILTVTPGLAITSNPVSVTTPVGQPFSFTASSTGSTPTKIQWQVSTDGGATYSNITGATRATFSVRAALTSQDGNLYRAAFTNAAGVAFSSAAELTVNFTVTLAKKQTISVRPGTTVTLAAQSKTTPTAFQWQVSIDKGKTWTDLPGETAATYTFTALSADNGKEFQAKLTLAKGTVKPIPAVLAVIDTPAAPTAPADVSVATGSTATFTTSAAATGTKIQWQVSLDGGLTFTDVKGQTKSTLKLTKVKASTPPAMYRAVFTDAVGVTLSGVATLTVT